MPDARLERTRAAYRETPNAFPPNREIREGDIRFEGVASKTDAIYEAIRGFDIWIREQIASLRHRAKRGA